MARLGILREAGKMAEFGQIIMDKETDIVTEPMFIYRISADNTAIVKIDEERITCPLID